MKQSHLSLAAFAFLASLASTSVARTWYAYPGVVQATINSASDGDSVVLVPGRFGDANLDFHGKAITVTSLSGPEFTVIDFVSGDWPGGPGHFDGFIFRSGEGPGSVLSGITILGTTPPCTGNANVRRIVCDGSSPTIENMRLLGTHIHIACMNGANPVIRNNYLCHCDLYNCGWIPFEPTTFGIECTDSSPTIIDNYIGQMALGVGIICTGGAPDIERNVVVENDAGGIVLNGSNATLRSNTIAHNYTGISLYQSAPLIDRCVIAFNRDAVQGGDPWLPIVSGSDFFGNTGALGDSIYGVDAGNNFSVDPLFCNGSYQLDMLSPCLPASSPGGELVGALPAGCGGGIVLTCPADVIVPTGSTLPHVVLDGLSIASLEAAPIAVRYAVTSALGPLTLHDNGHAASLGGTAVIDPGATFAPPDAALGVPVIHHLTEQFVEYSVWIDDVPAFFKGKSKVTLEPPVPVLISSFRAVSHESGIELTWAILTDEDVRGVRIYRSDRAGGNARVMNPGALLPTAPARYLDQEVLAGHAYSYTLAVVTVAGSEIMSCRVEARARSYETALAQNHPNPFNPATRISFTLAGDARATLTIHDVRGTLVVTLADERMTAGPHAFVWNGRDRAGNVVGSGIYFYSLKTGNHLLTRKMVLLK